MCIKIRGKLVDLSTPLIMGIINTTPDSFYSGSRLQKETLILERVNVMLMSGADILDIGGYSTKPGATKVSEQEEIDRTAPIIEAIRREFPEIIISHDTFRGKVAKEGVKAGADIVNDISGFGIDPTMLDSVAELKVPYVLMHMKGTPQTMQFETNYSNIYVEMMHYFSEKLALLYAKGIHDIIIDPGFGFSKTLEQNHFLLQNLEAFHVLQHPILLGISRKSMIYKKLELTPQEALHGTVALNAIGLSKGATILRVHDVAEAKQLVKLLK